MPTLDITSLINELEGADVQDAQLLLESTTTAKTMDALRRAIHTQQALRDAAQRVGIGSSDLIDAIIANLGLIGSAQNPETVFSESELQVLALAGVDLTPPTRRDDIADDVVAGAIRPLVRTLSVAEAADRLGITPGRVRQRITGGTLLGMRTSGTEWALPAWQFVVADGVPGLAAIVGRVPKTIHPAVLEGFMTRSDPDLVVDGRSLSPVVWLATGGDPEVVAELLEGLPGSA
jgi:hypothetical protein